MSVEIYEENKGLTVITVKGLGKYSLKDTLECGQCFRYENIASEGSLSAYIIVIGDLLVKAEQREIGEITFFGISREDFEEKIRPYFCLDRDLEEIRADIVSNTASEWLIEASKDASGISILKQDPWECLCSFIISQNNNIPRIRKIIREISAEYGVNLSLHSKTDPKCPLDRCSGTPCEEICKKCGVCYTFPKPEDIIKSPEKLLPSKPGFRYGYLVDAATKVSEGVVDLADIEAVGKYEYTLEKLKCIKGVGDKVASCVALFAFSNLEAFPIDVWMKRAIDTYFDGSLDPRTLGKYAGIAQQYIFHRIRNIENNKKN